MLKWNNTVNRRLELFSDRKLQKCAKCGKKHELELDLTPKIKEKRWLLMYIVVELNFLIVFPTQFILLYSNFNIF